VNPTETDEEFEEEIPRWGGFAALAAWSDRWFRRPAGERVPFAVWERAVAWFVLLGSAAGFIVHLPEKFRGPGLSLTPIGFLGIAVQVLWLLAAILLVRGSRWALALFVLHAVGFLPFFVRTLWVLGADNAYSLNASFLWMTEILLVVFCVYLLGRRKLV
jgi:hypothetical protein